jgi:GT2 family glycosyltransferase
MPGLNWPACSRASSTLLRERREPVTTAILIVSHNTRDDLKRCLDALLRTGASAEQIFVFDNGSTDGTADMLRRAYRGVHTILHVANLYYAEAVNRLAAAAATDYLLLLNPDTEPDYLALANLLPCFADHPRRAAVAPQLRYPDGRVQPSCRRLPDSLTPWREMIRALGGRGSYWKMSDFDHCSRRRVDQPMFSCLWIDRRAWDALGGLDTAYPLFFNDVDWCARARRAGFDLLFEPAVRVTHRLGGTTSRYPWRRHRHAHHGFARYILCSEDGWLHKLVGLSGVAVWFVLRLPGVLVSMLR